MKRIFLPCLLIAFVFVILSAGIAAAGPYHPGVSSGTPSGSPSIATTNLLRAYDLEHETGGKAKDFSVVGDHATESGSIAVGGATGLFGQATTFDGSTQELNGVAPAPVSPTTFTLALWAKPTASGKIVLTLENVQNTYIDFGFNAANKFSFALGTSGSITLTASATSGTGSWHSVVATYDGTNAVLRVDAVQVSVGQTGVHAVWNRFEMGGFGGGLKYAGVLDEVTLAGRVWNADEIAAYESTTIINPECGNGNAFNGAIPGAALIPILVLIMGAGLFAVVVFSVRESTKASTNVVGVKSWMGAVIVIILLLGILAAILPTIC